MAAKVGLAKLLSVASAMITLSTMLREMNQPSQLGNKLYLLEFNSNGYLASLKGTSKNWPYRDHWPRPTSART